MSEDQLLELIDSSLTIDTGSLVRDLGLFAMVPLDPQAVLNRFMVSHFVAIFRLPLTPP
jgi:hypothetical protein